VRRHPSATLSVRNTARTSRGPHVGNHIRPKQRLISSDGFRDRTTSWTTPSANIYRASPPPTDTQQADALVALKVVDHEYALALLDTPARALSMGQQQRLSLCRLLLDDSPVLVLDEPMAGIDGFTMRDVLPPVVQAVSSSKRTVLLVSHRPSFIAHATHVVVMSAQGNVIEQGDPRHLLTQSDKLSESVARPGPRGARPLRRRSKNSRERFVHIGRPHGELAQLSSARECQGEGAVALSPSRPLPNSIEVDRG
jgi:ABC-type multidrug transport system ATPase subunit